jgi:hypothetical protein
VFLVGASFLIMFGTPAEEAITGAAKCGALITAVLTTAAAIQRHRKRRPSPLASHVFRMCSVGASAPEAGMEPFMELSRREM